MYVSAPYQQNKTRTQINASEYEHALSYDAYHQVQPRKKRGCKTTINRQQLCLLNREEHDLYSHYIVLLTFINSLL